MLFVISPAKKLDFDSETAVAPGMVTEPMLVDHVRELVSVMQNKSCSDIKALMGLSDKLAELNYGRYQSFDFEEGRPALFAFKGDVYQNIATSEYDVDDLAYAQQHLRILSGLYGVLRPLDRMQPYRLEMGTKLKTDVGEDLYDFWGDVITEVLNASGDDVLVNVASGEYFSAVKPKQFHGTVVEVQFKENRGGVLKTIGLLAKRARGMFVDYAIRQRVDTLDGLRAFNVGGYAIERSLSLDDRLVFVR